MIPVAVECPHIAALAYRRKGVYPQIQPHNRPAVAYYPRPAAGKRIIKAFLRAYLYKGHIKCFKAAAHLVRVAAPCAFGRKPQYPYGCVHLKLDRKLEKVRLFTCKGQGIVSRHDLAAHARHLYPTEFQLWKISAALIYEQLISVVNFF